MCKRKDKKPQKCLNVIGIPKVDEVRNEGGLKANTIMSRRQLVLMR